MRRRFCSYALAALTSRNLASQLASAQSTSSHTSLITLTTTTSVTSTVTVYADSSTGTGTTSISQPSGTRPDSALNTIAALSAPVMAYTSALDSAVLNSTNFYRTRYTANPLTWNTTLATFAQSHAEQCIWEHSGGPYGENLAEGFAAPSNAIDAWANEERLYDWSHPGFSETTGHFTQLVWKATTQVGCGAAQCDNNVGNGAHGWFLVCEYSPAGNVGGEYAAEVEKAGMSDGGKPGLGGADASSRSSRVLVAMAAAYLMLSIVA